MSVQRTWTVVQHDGPDHLGLCCVVTAQVAAQAASCATQPALTTFFCLPCSSCSDLLVFLVPSSSRPPHLPRRVTAANLPDRCSSSCRRRTHSSASPLVCSQQPWRLQQPRRNLPRHSRRRRSSGGGASAPARPAAAAAAAAAAR